MSSVRDVVAEAVRELFPRTIVDTIIAALPDVAGHEVGTLDVVAARAVLRRLEKSLVLFGGKAAPDALSALRQRVTGGRAPPPYRVTIAVRSDADVLAAQRRCQDIGREFFGTTDCVRLATAVSELARNIYLYARQGEIDLELSEEGAEVRLSVTARDQGPGIADLTAVLEGRYTSRTGLGKGLRGVRNLLEGFQVDSSPERGTTIRGYKRGKRT